MAVYFFIRGILIGILEKFNGQLLFFDMNYSRILIVAKQVSTILLGKNLSEFRSEKHLTSPNTLFLSIVLSFFTETENQNENL